MQRAIPGRTAANSLVLLLALTTACGSLAAPPSDPRAPAETPPDRVEVAIEAAPALDLAPPAALEPSVGPAAAALPVEEATGSPSLQGAATGMSDVAGSFGFLSAYVGYRSMRSDVWEPLEDQLALGLDYTLRGPDSWLGIEFGMMGSYSDHTGSLGDTEAWSGELYLGPRIVFDVQRSPFQVYAGAGPSFVYVNVEAENSNNTEIYRSDDYTFGIYAHLGLLLRLNQRQYVGIEYRALRGTEVQVAGFDADADYNQLALVFASYL